jgi:hypothetical protein
MIQQQTNATNGRVPIAWPMPGPVGRVLEWYDPPIYDGKLEEHDTAYELLGKLKGLVEDKQLIWIFWNHVMRAARSTDEFLRLEKKENEKSEKHNAGIERLRQAIDGQIARIDATIGRVRFILLTVRSILVAAMARGRLSMSGLESREDENAPDEGGRQDTPYMKRISPALVEEALVNSAPSLENLGGESKISYRGKDEAPSPENPGGEHRTSCRVKEKAPWEWIFEILGPILSGFVLALNISVLTGLLKLSDLSRLDRIHLLAAAALVGGAIVYFIGHVACGAMKSMVVAAEPSSGDVPRLGGGSALSIVVWTVLIIVLIAEICTHTLGFMELHMQRIAEVARINKAANMALHPAWLYALTGALISGPYILYKAMQPRASAVLDIRLNYLSYRQYAWITERRKDPDVQQAFYLASVVREYEDMLEQREKKVSKLKDEMAALKTKDALDEDTMKRLRLAYEIATAESTRLSEILRRALEINDSLN